MPSKIELFHGDCLEVMRDIPDGSVDMILCDLPYGVLNKGNPNARWDTIIPFNALWKEYNRIAKVNSAIILFASGMFTADIMQSNRTEWRYNLIWDKNSKTGFLNAKRMPLRQHEDICVFYKRQPTYNPQMAKCQPHMRNHSKGNMLTPSKNSCYGRFVEVPTSVSDEKFPTSIISIPKEHAIGNFFHPTQKPVALCEYLIRTYTNEGETVLDNCAGSFTTAVACDNTNRKWICIEKEEEYCNIGLTRINDNRERLSLPLLNSINSTTVV